jgi:hypothetical protein
MFGDAVAATVSREPLYDPKGQRSGEVAEMRIETVAIPRSACTSIREPAQ